MRQSADVSPGLRLRNRCPLPRVSAPERALGDALAAEGLSPECQFPLSADSKKTIDFAFPQERVAVFADGCFWHACIEHARTPSRNYSYWEEVQDARRFRDIETDSLLTDQGWLVVRI